MLSKIEATQVFKKITQQQQTAIKGGGIITEDLMMN